VCGFAGEIRFDGQAADVGALQAMAARLQRRGPDSAGV
jgi:asparagine synthase (glutamine-hydrolysing)